MAAADFYEVAPEEQAAITLFNGWGYNFYRAENQLRSDDLMVRAKVGEFLGMARANVATAEAAYRREHLPPPSREHPRPGPEAVAGAQALEAIGRELGALEGQIRALPVPETDRMTQRLRDERETLERLLRADRAMVAAAHALSLTAEVPNILRQIAALKEALTARRALLQPLT